MGHPHVIYGNQFGTVPDSDRNAHSGLVGKCQQMAASKTIIEKSRLLLYRHINGCKIGAKCSVEQRPSALSTIPSVMLPNSDITIHNKTLKYTE